MHRAHIAGFIWSLSCCSEVLSPLLCDTIVCACRPQLLDTFTSFHRIWAEQASFAARLVRNLVKDMRAVAAAQKPAGAAQLRRFLAICNCVAAFAKACGAGLSTIIAGLVYPPRDPRGLRKSLLLSIPAHVLVVHMPVVQLPVSVWVCRASGRSAGGYVRGAPAFPSAAWRYAGVGPRALSLY